MEEETWESIQIEEVIVNENSDTIFLRCKTTTDASKFTARARNLPQDLDPTEAPRLNMWVDQRASKRYKAIQAIAKAMRDHTPNTIQTTIRTGKRDFLLRRRDKGDTTPWVDIPPIIINQKLPDFEVGEYFNIINPEDKASSEPENSDKGNEEIEDIDRIAHEISKQSSIEDTNKRDRTTEADLQNKRKRNDTSENLSQTPPNMTPEPSDDEDQDPKTDKNTIRQLNSTLINHPTTHCTRSLQHTDNNTKMLTHYFSVPESPCTQTKQKHKILTIPETPEYGHQNTPHPTKGKKCAKPQPQLELSQEAEPPRTIWDSLRQDDEIIQEMNLNKHTTNHHGQ